MKKYTPEQALADAIAAVGTASALARELDITREAVSQWKQVPADRVLAVEKATGGKVDRYSLRPDIYGERPRTTDAAA